MLVLKNNPIKILIGVSVIALFGNIAYKNSSAVNTVKPATQVIAPSVTPDNLSPGDRIEWLTRELESEKLNALSLQGKLSDDKEIARLTKELESESEKTSKLQNELDSQNSELRSFVKKALIEEVPTAMVKGYVKTLSSMDKTKVNNNIDTKDKDINKVDYINTVALKNSKASSSSLQKSIDGVYNKQLTKPVKTAYLKGIDDESKIRQDAVRMVVIEKNDTLWLLAKKVYGDGKLYPKILAANPQITMRNVRFLRIGTRIRVPARDIISAKSPIKNTIKAKPAVSTPRLPKKVVSTKSRDVNISFDRDARAALRTIR